MPVATSGQHVLDVVAAITAAYLLALPLGWERKARGAAKVGLRTLPLVSVATCGYLLLGRFLHEAGVIDADGQARALRAMMTGVGFIGGGAILKDARGARRVTGITTATSVWTSGAIGASVAHGYYSIGTALALTCLLVVGVTGRFARPPVARTNDAVDAQTPEQPTSRTSIGTGGGQPSDFAIVSAVYSSVTAASSGRSGIEASHSK